MSGWQHPGWSSRECSHSNPHRAAKGPPTPREWIVFSLLFYGVLAGLALLWRLGFVGASIFYASERAAAQGVAWFSDGLVGFASAGLLIFLSRQFMERSRVGKEAARALAGALGSLPVVHTTVLACISGVVEELVFRGALQPAVGLVAASLLFGMVHFVPRRDLLWWPAFATLAGFLLGAIYLGTGNLFAPILAHTLINAVNLPYLVRKYGVRVDKCPVCSF